jgi:adenylyl-sulfate kinase
MAIIGKKLEEGKKALILVRDTPISESNPYTVEQRIKMIQQAYGDDYGEKVVAVGFPDFEGIAYGRGVGWQIEEVDVGEEIAKISATAIRNDECNAMNDRVSKYLDIQKSTLWFTGLPCSGKTTIAKHMKDELESMGYDVVLLDGDDVRTGLCSDLGFSPDDRKENLRRISHLCNMYNSQNKIVLATFVSPTEEIRQIPKDIIDNLKLIYVSTPLEVCEERDTKGMYKKARTGEIPNFTGISAPFEVPNETEIVIDGSFDASITAHDLIMNMEIK